MLFKFFKKIEEMHRIAAGRQGIVNRTVKMVGSSGYTLQRPVHRCLAARVACLWAQKELIVRLDSIQDKAKDQQATLAAAGRMPPPSPILQHLKETEMTQTEVPRQVRPQAQQAQTSRDPAGDLLQAVQRL